MNLPYGETFVKSLKKRAAIRKAVKARCEMIAGNPHMGEPLKGNWRGYWCPVKRNFIIIYLYCKACRSRGNDAVAHCAECEGMEEETIQFLYLGPHDRTYGI